MTATTGRLAALRTKTGGAVARVIDTAASVPSLAERARQGTGLLTPLGKAVAVIGAVSWGMGWLLGWRELLVIAASCWVLLLLCAAFVVGRDAFSITVGLEPARVVAGDPSAGQVDVVNVSGRRTLPLRVELPVGAGVAVFDVSSLAPGETCEEIFVVPTERRGVTQVGPATSVRGDPLGLLRRVAASSRAYELIVHPRTVGLDPFGSGLLRDLEGLVSRDLSVSDLAFHALREYAPGDDRRYVHWRTSARAGRLMVRQFQDTRRSTLCVVADGRTDGYEDPEQFETALEVAASLALRACRDNLTATVVAAGPAASGSVPHLLLDALSRAALAEACPDLRQQAVQVASRGADVSFAMLVSGSGRSVEDLQRAASAFPPEVRVVAVRVLPDAPAAIRSGGRAIVVNLPTLGDLPAVLRSGGAA